MLLFTVSRAISNILSFLFLQTGPGGMHQSFVVWIEPETTKGAVGSKLFSDFIDYGSPNQPLWEISWATKYLFQNTEVCRGEVYLQIMQLPKIWLETVHHYGFFKAFPRILCTIRFLNYCFIYLFLFLFIPFAVCLLSEKVVGELMSFPHQVFRMRKLCVTSCSSGLDQSSSPDRC